jgi:malate dehydrogenase (oxaloacetate-decarboxylating)(NADP+)
MGLDDDALDYHSRDPPGKVAVETTKPTSTQRDLSLAYSPGVAAPCRAIADDPAAAYDYTAKGNLVGMVSNGTAVLGLGDIGAQASKPVIEGEGVLLKRFADIDVFDVELDIDDPDAIVETVALTEPSFGGIHLEDIAAPDCFAVEERLRERMDIPVYHDDQHGTAIVSGAALLNASISSTGTSNRSTWRSPARARAHSRPPSSTSRSASPGRTSRWSTPGASSPPTGPRQVT